MAKYYVNDRPQKTSKGEHEVHTDTCPFLHLIVSKTYIGEHSTCEFAMLEAGKQHINVDGCATCCPNCHNI
jgi:hypothetical protein